MSSLYDKISELCSIRGISAGKMCSETGISRGLITDLKMGRKQSPTGETLKRIAEYFDVSVDFLLGKENKPTIHEDNELINDELIAFYGGAKKDLTQADIDDIKSLIRLRAELNRGKE